MARAAAEKLDLSLNLSIGVKEFCSGLKRSLAEVAKGGEGVLIATLFEEPSRRFGYGPHETVDSVSDRTELLKSRPVLTAVAYLSNISVGMTTDATSYLHLLSPV